MIIKDFDNCTIDTNAIKMRTINTKGIELPYKGQLPERYADARIIINLPIAKAPHAALVLTSDEGKEWRYSLDASNAELKELLRRFFFNDNGVTRFDCGLTEYWLGALQANFIIWERMSSSPAYAVDVLEWYEPSDRDKALKWIERYCEHSQTA